MTLSYLPFSRTVYRERSKLEERVERTRQRKNKIGSPFDFIFSLSYCRRHLAPTAAFTSSRFRTCSSTRRLTPLANSYRTSIAARRNHRTCFLLEFELFTATISCLVDVISIRTEQSYSVFVPAREQKIDR